MTREQEFEVRLSRIEDVLDKFFIYDDFLTGHPARSLWIRTLSVLQHGYGWMKRGR